MEQSYQPDYGKVMQGESVQSSDEEILAMVRKILTADEVEHPDVIREAEEAAARKSSWTGRVRSVERAPAAPVSGSVAGSVAGSMAARLLGRFRSA